MTSRRTNNFPHRASSSKAASSPLPALPQGGLPTTLTRQEWVELYRVIFGTVLLLRLKADFRADRRPNGSGSAQ